MTTRAHSLEKVYTRPLNIGDDQPLTSAISRIMGQACNAVIRRGRFHLSRWGIFDQPDEAATISTEQFQTRLNISPEAEYLTVILMVRPDDDDGAIRVLDSAPTEHTESEGVTDAKELHEVVVQYDVSGDQGTQLAFFLNATESQMICGVTIYETELPFVPDTATGFVDVTALLKNKVLRAIDISPILDSQRQIGEEYLKNLVNDTCMGEPLVELTAPTAAAANVRDTAVTAYSSSSEGYWISPSPAWGVANLAKLKCQVLASMVSGSQEAEIHFKTSTDTSNIATVNTTSPAWYEIEFTVTTQENWYGDHEFMIQLFAQGSGGNRDMCIHAIVIDEEDSRPRSPRFKALDFERTPPSVANLDPLLTINGTTVAPTLFYVAEDVSGITWPARCGGAAGLLTEAGGGASPTVEGSPLMGADAAVAYPAAKFHASAGNTFGTVTTGDAVLRCLITAGATTSGKRVLGHLKTAGGARGWDLYYDVTGVSLNIFDEDGTVAVKTAALTPGVTYYCEWYMDRSGSGIAYTNASAGSAVDISAVEKTLAQTSMPFNIGAAANAGMTDCKIHMLALYEGTATWLDSHLQLAAAQESFRKLTGSWPQVAKGTANPPVASRSSAKYIKKWNPTTSAYEFYKVGDDWLSVWRIKDASANVRTKYWPEPEVENTATTSVALASWTNTTSTDGTGIASPLKGLTTLGLTETVDNASHFIATPAAVSYTNATAYCYSVIAHAGSRDWFALRSYNSAAPIWANFDLTNGVTGNSSGVTSGMIDLGGGFWLCYMFWTHSATESRTLHMHLRDADTNADPNGTSYVGSAAAVATHLIGAQCEPGTYPTSLIETTVAATRNADHLRYKGDDGNLDISAGDGDQLRITFDMVSDSADGSGSLIDVSDGGAGTDRILYWRNPTDKAKVSSAASGGSPGSVTGSTSLSDGDQHSLEMRFATDSLKVLVDGAEEGTEDTSVDISDDKDRINVGEQYTATAQANCGLSNVCIYDRAS